LTIGVHTATLCHTRVVRNPEVRLLLRYILPNVAAPIIITSSNLGAAIPTESTLSFLGSPLA
jgi:ABC-type dipeptide/oligopeptide/nickel transport system permease subunit